MSELPEVPGFRIERLLGEGAHGRVFFAREESGLKRPVALKLFAREHREKFERELEVQAKVEELRRRERAVEIVQALGSGEAEGGLSFIALEHLERGSLADVVARDGPLDAACALGFVVEAARGLALMHREGLFHRDVKPANLLVGGDGRVRLSDFGLSRALSGTLSAAGSPAFAAPEVIAGKPADGRLADVYSLGATLAFLLTGETILPGRPDVFALERRGVPRAVQQAIVAACAAEPRERLASVEAFAAQLDGALEEKSEEKPRGKSAARDGSPGGANAPEPMRGDPTVRTEADYESVSTMIRPRTSRGAIASLVCALLVIPSLVAIAVTTSYLMMSERRSAMERDMVARRDAMVREHEQAVRRQKERDAAERGETIAPSPEPSPVEPSPDARARDEDAATTKLVVTLVAVGVPLTLEVLAFVFGFVGLSRIRASAGALTGRGLAIAGIVIASLNVAGPLCLSIPAALFLAKGAERAPAPAPVEIRRR